MPTAVAVPAAASLVALAAFACGVAFTGFAVLPGLAIVGVLGLFAQLAGLVGRRIVTAGSRSSGHLGCLRGRCRGECLHHRLARRTLAHPRFGLVPVD